MTGYCPDCGNTACICPVAEARDPSLSPHVIAEKYARRILQQTINESRCAEFVDCMWDGGSATLDAKTGQLVLISGDQLLGMAGGQQESSRESG